MSNHEPASPEPRSTTPPSTLLAETRRSGSVQFIPEHTLRQLISGDLLAVVFKGFFQPPDAAEIADRLLRAPWDSYGEAITINRLGVPLFDCLGDSSCDHYFAAAPLARATIQDLLSPFVNPADLVHRELDQLWPHGCNILSIRDNKCFLGLPRAFSSGGEAIPHTDRCDWDMPCAETRAVRQQLAFNIYLSLSSQGGELELWHLRPEREEYDALRDGYGLKRALLPKPSVVLAPEVGDLIFFNASRVHAVRPAQGDGSRITMSGFIGYRGPQAPLATFS